MIKFSFCQQKNSNMQSGRRLNTNKRFFSVCRRAVLSPAAEGNFSDMTAAGGLKKTARRFAVQSKCKLSPHIQSGAMSDKYENAAKL